MTTCYSNSGCTVPVAAKKPRQPVPYPIYGAQTAGTYGCKGVYATKISGRVFIDFSVIKTDAWNGDAALIATIPTGWRPKGLEYLIVPTAGARIARISVSPDGELRLGMVRFLTDGAQDTTTAGLWLQGNINYEPA